MGGHKYPPLHLSLISLHQPINAAILMVIQMILISCIMQNILSIDCSSSYLSTAIKCGDSIISCHSHKPRQHNELLIPTIEWLLKEAKLTLPDLDAICVGRGPGSFVGVRLAISLVQGMAFGLDIPVIPLSSLQLIAQQYVKKHPKITIAVDAQMGDVYLGHFERENGVMIPMEETVIKAEQLRAHYGDDFVDTDNAIPHAKCAFELIDWTKENGLILPADQAQPVYLRGTSNWKKINE